MDLTFSCTNTTPNIYFFHWMCKQSLVHWIVKQSFVHWMCQQSFLLLLTIPDINLKADSVCSQPDYVANLKRCKTCGLIKYKDQ